MNAASLSSDELRTLRAVIDARGAAVVAREAGVSLTSTTKAVAGLRCLPVVRKALLQACNDLGTPLEGPRAA